MAHYAFLDENNTVVKIIPGRNENESVGGVTDWESYYGSQEGLVCKRTSYNTFGNEHNQGGTPFRGNYAGIGFEYREDLDAFIAPKPFDSWLLNAETLLWEAPIPFPDDTNEYEWDEESTSWVQIESLDQGESQE